MKPLLTFILFLAIALLLFNATALAHGGRKHEEKPAAPVAVEVPAAMDSTFTVGEDEATPAQDSIYSINENSEEDQPASLFSRQDSFSGEMPMGGEMTMQMDHSGGEHADHTMPQVKLAEHEMVSTESKGYGVAAAITLLSGLVFGFLSFKRPNE